MQTELSLSRKIYGVLQQARGRLHGIVAEPDSRLMRLARVALKVLLVAYFVFCAIFLCLRYVVLPHIGQYKPNIEKMLSEGLGRQISISGIDTSWYGFRPLLKLHEVIVHDPEGNVALQLPEVRVTVSWWSFAFFELRLALLEINRPELDIRRDKAGNLFVAGLPVNTGSRKKGGGMDWMLKQNTITIRDGIIRWNDEMRSAPELVMEKLNFTLENDGRRHRMRFLAHSNMTHEGEIDIRADFVHPFFAERISDSTGWNGRLYVALPPTELEPWKPYVDIPYGLKKGRGTINAWMNFDRARIADMTADVDLNDVQLKLEPGLPELNLVSVSGRVSAREIFEAGSANDNLSLGKRPHAIELADLFLETADGIKMESVDFSEKHTPAVGDQESRTEITMDELDLSALIRLAKYLPLTPEQHRMLQDFSPAGQLDRFSIQWVGKYPDLVSYQVNGKFRNLSMNATSARIAQPKTATRAAQANVPAIPGFSNLTGSISANEHGGTLELDSDNAILNLPSYFPKADWHFDELDLQAHWSHSAQNEFVFAIKKMDFLMDGISASVSGRHVKPLSDDKKSPGVVDMTATVKRFDMTKTGHYVPLQAKEVLRVWLSKAFEEGEASNITVHLKGDISRFPFADTSSAGGADGVFRVRMDVNNVRLNYAPTMLSGEGKLLWQPIEKINGWLTIEGAKIVIHADNAILSGAALSNVDVVVPDMLAEDASLNITGSADGELQDFIRFVNSSPVNDVIGGLTEETKTVGKTGLLLKMQMPLSNMANSKVQGTVRFASNEIRLFPELPVLTEVQGNVHFSDKGFELDGINARFLGGSSSIQGGTKDGRSQVRASGTITAEGLRKNYSGGMLGKLMKRLSGSMPYTLSVTQKKAGARGGGYPDIVIESGLAGFGIDLPAPLGKKSAETRQLRVLANPVPSAGKNRRDEIHIVYGDNASAHYERQKADNHWQLARGGIGINMKPTLHPGVSLDLSMKSLDVNVWQEALASLLVENSKEKAASGSEPDIGKYVDPQRFFIKADSLAAMNFRLTGAAITGSHLPGQWQVDVDANEMKGRLIWAEPHGKQSAGKLTARLLRLVIPRLDADRMEDAIKRDHVRQMPEIDMVADDFTLFDVRLGHTELLASNVVSSSGREWRIGRLNISNPDAKLLASGNWFVESTGAQRTRMDYKLNIRDAGKLLDRFGYKEILNGGKGKMQGNISWAGLPYSLDIPSLSGKMELDVGKGQFLKVEPGVAKLLGVLSMQSLPRRLTLDFRDVFSDGFAFDEITGRVGVEKGVARTENLTMKGVLAVVLMDGSVDIARETQNLHVAVLPEINAGSASLVYSLINPVVGVSSFLAQLLLKEPLSKTFTYEYQITGAWTEPNIQKIKNKDSRVQKFIDAIKPTEKTAESTEGDPI